MTMPAPPSQVLKDAAVLHAKAFLILYSQEYLKNPTLTFEQFRVWVAHTHAEHVKTAKALHDATLVEPK